MTMRVFPLYQTGWQRRRRSGRWEGTPRTPKGINQEGTSQGLGMRLERNVYAVADVLSYLVPVVWIMSQMSSLMLTLKCWITVLQR